jgi:hypothetical protein
MKRPPLTFSLGLARALSGPFALRAAASETPATPVLVDLNQKGTITEEPAPMNRDGQPVSDNLAGVVVEAPTGRTLVMVQAEFLRHLLMILVRRQAAPPRPDRLAPAGFHQPDSKFTNT